MEQNEKYKNLSLKKKLFISHGFIIAVAAVIAVLLLVGLNIVKGNVSGIFNGPLANIDSVGKVRYGITDLQRAINRILTEDSSQVGNSYVNFEKTVTEDVSLITDSVQQMQNRKMNTESTALLNQLASKIDEGEKVRSKLMTQIKAGRYSEAVELNNNTYLPIVNDIKSLSEQLGNSIDKTAVNYYTMTKYTGVGMTVAGILLLIADVVFGLRVTRKMASAIVEPVQEITEAAKIMYSGDMSVGERITYESEDEIGQLADALRGTTKNLSDYVNEISAILQCMATGDLTEDSDEITDFLGDFASIKESFVRIDNGEVIIYGMHINPYEKGNIFNKDPLRPKKLMLHKYEINKLVGKLNEKGLTLVPLQVYFKGSLVKVEIGLARGKKLYDKRQDIAKRDMKRENEREFKHILKG